MFKGNKKKKEESEQKEKVITELTKEQEAMIPVFLEKYQNIGLSTEPTDKGKAEAAVKASYAYLKHSEPEIVWAEDPFEGAKLAAQYAAGNEVVTDEQIRDQASLASYGSFEAQWVVFYAYIDEVLGIRKDELIDIAKDIVQHCGLYWTFDGLVVMTPKPTKIHMVDNKLHNPEGLALAYSTGRGIYAIDGVRKNNLMEVALEEKFKASGGKKAANE